MIGARPAATLALSSALFATLRHAEPPGNGEQRPGRLRIPEQSHLPLARRRSIWCTRDGLEPPGGFRASLERLVALFVPVIVLAVTSLLGWIAYLIFCRYLVSTTKDPASLKYAAIAARAFPQVLGKLFSRRGR